MCTEINKWKFNVKTSQEKLGSLHYSCKVVKGKVDLLLFGSRCSSLTAQTTLEGLFPIGFKKKNCRK